MILIVIIVSTLSEVFEAGMLIWVFNLAAIAVWFIVSPYKFYEDNLPISKRIYIDFDGVLNENKDGK